MPIRQSQAYGCTGQRLCQLRDKCCFAASSDANIIGQTPFMTRQGTENQGFHDQCRKVLPGCNSLQKN